MQRPARRRWIPFVVVNALVTFFGATYVWFPMGTVEQEGNQTAGVLKIAREVWGSYVMLSALVMLVIAVTAYRAGARWAWWALWYEIAFFAAVAAIEPDPVVPTVFSLVLGHALWRSRPGVTPSHLHGAPA